MVWCRRPLVSEPVCRPRVGEEAAGSCLKSSSILAKGFEWPTCVTTGTGHAERSQVSRYHGAVRVSQAVLARSRTSASSGWARLAGMHTPQLPEAQLDQASLAVAASDRVPVSRLEQPIVDDKEPTACVGPPALVLQTCWPSAYVEAWSVTPHGASPAKDGLVRDAVVGRRVSDLAQNAWCQK
ncbi:hypothetical protein CDD81_395 [Ophiocordyceps australis]|uniref:Uncharacterized protein n=1 Tax=Ophiocordyceps australis TaxID=1399860 RepID=A0A2C5Y393_9HYPO|nr:hypothetical protein CDD81_395 [Ophiocordyceps australis]